MHDPIILELPWTKPPLSANQRLHWAQRARVVKEVRTISKYLALSKKVGELNHIIVRLHYVPRDKRRRDPSNMMPTQKALLDGLVDAKVVPDDCPPYVIEWMPVVETPDGKNARMYLEIIPEQDI